MLRRTFSTPEALRRLPFGLADVTLILGTLVLVGLIACVGAGTLISFVPPDVVPSVSLDPLYKTYSNLPIYRKADS